MSLLRSLFYAFSAAAVVGCGAGSPTLAPGATTAFTDARTAPREREPASTLPVESGARYAYVSDTYAGKVYVYAWSVPGMKRGTYLRSFRLTEPFGGCADGQGDVYITHFNGDGSDNGDIVEYRGDSNRRLRRLVDPGNVPFSCAIDPKTGDIAVANLEVAATSGGGGSVLVYPGGKGHGIRFDDLPSAGGTLQAIYFVAYDGSGKLYADGSVAPCHGFTYSAAPFDAHVDVLPSCCSTSSAFVPVTLKGEYLGQVFQWPGALIWDGRHLDVGDREATQAASGSNCASSQGCALLYVAREGGSPTEPTLTEKALTVFDAAGSPSGINNGDVAWGVGLADGKNVVPSFVSPGSAVQVYKYPIGGAEIAGWGVPGSAQTPAFATISRTGL